MYIHGLISKTTSSIVSSLQRKIGRWRPDVSLERERVCYSRIVAIEVISSYSVLVKSKWKYIHVTFARRSL